MDGTGSLNTHRSAGGLLARMVAVGLVGIVIGVAADRWALSNLTPTSPILAAIPPSLRVGPFSSPGRAAPTSSPTDTASAPSSPAQQAIQQVIQRGDEEQAQALATNDPSVMADTATSDFYQQQVQNNDDLQSNGATAIKLVNVFWGPITMDGATATATDDETWSTTYSDGTTDQSRDRNVYTLTQENGTWKIAADDHPDEDGGSGSGGTPGVPAPGAPGSGSGAQGSGNPAGRAAAGPTPAGPGLPFTPPVGQETSRNWAGYVATKGAFTAVSATWTVPQFTPDSPAGADATWVGIGGANSRDLIQAGTQQTVSGSGSTEYEAWVETLPGASHPVLLALNPGDSVSVSISQQPGDGTQWQVAFANRTTGQALQVTEVYASSLSSAEWIEEAPSTTRSRQLPLDAFGSISFTEASLTRNGQTLTAAAAGAQPITIAARGGQVLAKPSSLGPDGSSFTVSQE